MVCDCLSNLVIREAVSDLRSGSAISEAVSDLQIRPVVIVEVMLEVVVEVVQCEVINDSKINLMTTKRTTSRCRSLVMAQVRTHHNVIKTALMFQKQRTPGMGL